MKSTLIYTFRTFPYIEELNTITNEVFILSKLKEDLLQLEKIINEGNFDYICGIAKASTESVFETKAVNQFNKGKISKNGKDMYSLYYPKKEYIEIGLNNSYTSSFCNWGMYNVAKIIDDNQLSVNHSFIHILEKDIPTLKQYLESK